MLVVALTPGTARQPQDLPFLLSTSTPEQVPPIVARAVADGVEPRAAGPGLQPRRQLRGSDVPYAFLMAAS